MRHRDSDPTVMLGWVLIVVGTTVLNVRRTPDTSEAAIGTLAGDEVVARLRTVTGASVRGTTDWYEVEKPGLRGYISSSYATCAD